MPKSVLAMIIGIAIWGLSLLVVPVFGMFYMREWLTHEAFSNIVLGAVLTCAGGGLVVIVGLACFAITSLFKKNGGARDH